MPYARRMVALALATGALAAGVAAPAAAAPNENASCVAQFGSEFRENVPGPFGQSVSQEAQETNGIRGGEFANHHCGTRGNPH